MNHPRVGDSGLISATSSSRSLQSLNRLELRSVTAEVATALFDTLVALNLAHLTVTFNNKPSWSPSQFIQLFSSVTKNYPNLVELGLSTLGSSIHSILGYLGPLEALPIRSLRMSSWLYDDFELADASRTVENWAELKELDIGLAFYPVEDLGDILSFHPNLTVLRISLSGCTWPILPIESRSPSCFVYQALSLISDFEFCEDCTENELNDLAR
ncbi:hypothetical protein FRC12_015634 [Ceratobasidium sp. 428]|nr:hypothetical protein FRC12_015634 [Ceratobasidium sp. 428]